MDPVSAKQAVVKEAEQATAAAPADAAPAEPQVDEAQAVAEAPAEETAATESAATGNGPIPANEDGSAPEGADIKGNADSMKYHVPGSRWYDQTTAEVWFASVEDAKAAGYAPAGGEAAQKVSE